MKCLIVGTDKLGSAPDILKDKFGLTEYEHWTGRDRLPKQLPRNTKMVVVYSGYVRHDVMWAVKKMAKTSCVRLLFVKRGLSELADMVS